MGRPKKEGEYIPLNVKLPKELVERLDEYSEKTKIPKTGVTELALTEYLEKHDNKSFIDSKL